MEQIQAGRTDRCNAPATPVRQSTSMHFCTYRYHQRNWDGTSCIMYETCAQLLAVRKPPLTDLKIFFRIIHGPHEGRRAVLRAIHHECAIPEPPFHELVNRILVKDHKANFYKLEEFSQCIGRIYCIRYSAPSEGDCEQAAIRARDVLFRYAEDYDFSNDDFW